MPNVHLVPETRDFAERAVALGAFGDVSQVVDAALRLLMQQPGLEAFAKLRREMRDAIDELDRGGGTPFDPRAYEPDAFK
jgi:antitoxin ParD1/3/4